jgi:alkylation response protein AidB-like acyl-CoA dehydrogenase
MSVTALRSSPRRPDVPELLSRARAITDIVRARVKETEANRRIADDVIARMREAELFRILQPQAYGGFEYGFDVFAELVATIGRGCGSSAWVYGLGAVHQWFVACFPKEAQEEFWADAGAIAARSARLWQPRAVIGPPECGVSPAVATMRSGTFCPPCFR